MDKKKMKKKELFLILGILILATVAVIFIFATRTEGEQVVITVDGQFYKTLPLNQDETLIIVDKAGNENKLVIKDKQAKMIEADCPDQICVNHSGIHYNHQSIVCLPNKVVVEVQSKETSDVDIIAR